MIILAVDFGDARTGLACCDRSELLASPAGVISETDFEVCIQKTAEAAREHRAEQIVVGYPKNMNGTIGGGQKNAPCLQKNWGHWRELKLCSGMNGVPRFRHTVI